MSLYLHDRMQCGRPVKPQSRMMALRLLYQFQGTTAVDHPPLNSSEIFARFGLNIKCRGVIGKFGNGFHTLLCNLEDDVLVSSRDEAMILYATATVARVTTPHAFQIKGPSTFLCLITFHSNYKRDFILHKNV